jgi:release factor glutamine methyltransferase
VASIGKTVWNTNVYEPSDDSFILTDALRADAKTWGTFKPAITVEVGCGSGFVICSAALLLQQLEVANHCIALDVSKPAVQATRNTLVAHRVTGVDTLAADMFTTLLPRLHRGVDLLLFNPPYVVTPDEEVARGGIAAAWAGGRDGRVVIDRLLAQLDDFLSPLGRMYMVTIEQNRPLEIMRELKQRFALHGRIVLQRRADEELLSVLLICRQPLEGPVASVLG